MKPTLRLHARELFGLLRGSDSTAQLVSTLESAADAAASAAAQDEAVGEWRATVSEELPKVLAASTAQMFEQYGW